MKSSNDLLERTEKALMTPYSTSTTTPGHEQSEASNELVLLVNHVFAEMKLTWGRKYAARFKGTDEVNATKRQWAKTFSRLRISARQVRFALDRAIESEMEWPPELPEFLKLCGDPAAFGLPSAEEAFKEIVKRHGIDRFVEDYEFSHRLVEVVNERIGNYCTSESEKAFKTRFNKAFKEALTELRKGVLPPKHHALPAPKLPAKSSGYEVNPNCPIQKRIHALRDAQGQHHG